MPYLVVDSRWSRPDQRCFATNYDHCDCIFDVFWLKGDDWNSPLYLKNEVQYKIEDQVNGVNLSMQLSDDPLI